MIKKQELIDLQFVPRASGISKLMGTKGLGKVGIDYVAEYLSNKIKGINSDCYSMYTEKGTVVEDKGIELGNNVFKTNHVKNGKFFANKWICGTPDILDEQDVIDYKCSWSFSTFEAIDNLTKPPVNYFWQLMAYMYLTGTRKAKLRYALINTPEALIESAINKAKWNDNAGEELDPVWVAEIYNKHTFNDLPDFAKIIDFDFDYCEESITLMKSRITDARIIFEELKVKKIKRYFI